MFCTAVAILPAQSVPAREQRPAIAAQYSKLPLSFEPNQGQASPQVRFLARGNGYSLFLTDTSAVLALRGGKQGTDTVRMDLAGARQAPHLEPEDRLEGTSSYFVGTNPAKWQPAIPTYGKVRFDNVYRGINLLYYGNQGQLEYDFLVSPHAHPDAIRLRFAGARDLKLNGAGDLQVLGSHDEVAFHRPVVYQQRAGVRQEISAAYRLLPGGEVGFSLGRYDHSLPLTIDPVLVYSTYLGGDSYYGDQAAAIAVDSTGSAYITGATTSGDFPVTPGAYDTDQKDRAQTMPYPTAFISKLNPAGTALVYSTFLGVERGYQSQSGNAIVVDDGGNAYVVGTSNSLTFPVTPGAFQTSPPLYEDNNPEEPPIPNVFVTKLNPTGTALVYSTFLGQGDDVGAIAVDHAGNAYIGGRESSYSNIGTVPTTPGAFQTSSPYGTAAFIAKLNPAGSALVYSTYLGGSGGDAVNALTLDASGNAYVAGKTSSDDFPVTQGAFQTTRHSASPQCSSAFAAKLNATGSALLYATYLGGSGTYGGSDCSGNDDVARAIAIDTAGHAYVVGSATSRDFPVSQGAFQPQNHAQYSYLHNAFVTELNPAGTGVVYSTYLGGTGTTSSNIAGDLATGVAVDRAGHAYVVGYGDSMDFPVTPYAFQVADPSAASGGSSVHLTEVNPTGTGLIYSTYLGGSTNDAASGIAIDASGNLYITGYAYSSDFPITPGAFQTQLGNPGNSSNAFITKLNLGGSTNAPARLELVSGTHQTATINTAFAQPLVVKVVDKNNQPVAGVVVDFSAASTGSTAVLSAMSAITGADGTASVTATANGTAGSAGYTPSATAPVLNERVNFSLVNTKASAVVSLYLLDRVYTGYGLGAFAKTNPPGLTVRFSYDGDTGLAPTAVGTHSVTATIVDNNYEGSASATLVIEKAAPQITFGGLTQSFTGSPLSVTATTSPAGLPVVLTYNGSTTPPSAVGSYTVKATVSTANENGSATGTFTIKPALGKH